MKNQKTNARKNAATVTPIAEVTRLRDMTESANIGKLTADEALKLAHEAEREGRLGFYRLARLLAHVSTGLKYRKEDAYQTFYAWYKGNGFDGSEGTAKALQRVGRFGLIAGITEELALKLGQEHMLAMAPLVLGGKDENRVSKYAKSLDTIIGRIVNDAVKPTVGQVRIWVKDALGESTDSSAKPGSAPNEPKASKAGKDSEYPAWKKEVLSIVAKAESFESMMVALEALKGKADTAKAA